MKIIKGGVLVYSDHSEKKDLGIEKNRIVKIGDDIVPTAEDGVYDASGCFVFPGFIDAHTHFDMATATAHTADDFTSGTQAAAVGGTTTVIDFATQEQGETLSEAYDNWRRKADGKSSCNYRFHMAVTDWSEETPGQMQELLEKGVTSYKMYMAYENLLSGDDAILACLKEVKKWNGTLGVHCENGALVKELTAELVREGKLDPSSHPLSRPAQVEAEAVNRLAYIGALADHPVTVVHLSSEAGLREVRNARAAGIRVNVETCPQYLLLDDSRYSLPDFESAKYVMSPPLRKKSDNAALTEAVRNGEIDTIATDHCSFFFADKKLGEHDFRQIPNGGPGVEHRVALVYTCLKEAGVITENDMVRMMAENPAKLYGIYPQKGVLAEGSDADIVVYDPKPVRTITAAKQTQRVDYTPYEGMKIKGSMRNVFVNGECVVADDRMIKTNCGSYVYGTKEV